ncbi:cysteine desulfurase family protein [Cellulosilyticum sp. WCF-2]|uniref:cysteine desulfurase family protein n=1 Tax=Cellulosilyticum sp. WCF-2 TaxID=2497860 RepID=UPI000F8C3B54|nr:cysteine desulfurase family protein [Cellulosilyticum sp. WCF-2]QEH67654.1 cysteine desulfurase [Cellulosilyticum sp. WCF-2]
MIYLDNASTTPVAPEVIDAMVEELQHYGNPSSKFYPEALSAQARLKKYRETTANLFSCDPSNIIFNAGATEGNNHVIMGCFYAYPEKRHFITTNAEHKSVLETMRFLESLGTEVTYLPVSEKCTINPDDLVAAIKEDTNLVSIFFANNEVGSLNDIEVLSTICKENNVLFHTDATQAVGKVDINLSTDYKNVDFLTFSGHKIHGPKGVGALYVGNNVYGVRHKLTPLLHGGDQEFKLRSGTQSMHNIAGLAKACELAKDHIFSMPSALRALELEFIDALNNTFPEQVKFFGSLEHKVPGILSFAIHGINNEMFLSNYCDKVALSTGSACAIGEPSYVLKAMGFEDYTDSVLRISVSSLAIKINDFISLLNEYINLYTL